MLRIIPKQSSFHTLLYNKIPQNHILRIVDETVDFSFINELLQDTYCKRFGRPGKEPILMCKLLFLKHMYNLSDKRLIEEASLNLAHLYFLHLNPEDELPNDSLLSKFRRHRIDETTLDEIITEIVRQCVEKNIIDSGSVSIDSTHIVANTFNNTAERLMKKIARKVIKTHQKDDKDFTSAYEEPDYEAIKDHHEAKRVMVAYVNDVIKEVESAAGDEISDKTTEAIEQGQEIMADPKFLAHKGARSLIDTDARVGHKTKFDRFFGYKTEFIMTSKEHIITAVCTESGSYTDGSNTKELLDKTLEGNIVLSEFYADKAYFRKPILEEIKVNGGKPFIPIHHGMYRMDETKYSYNKDSDEWSCHRGNTSEKRKHFKTTEKGKQREGYKYYFPKSQCEHCPDRESCVTGNAKRKILNVGSYTAQFYELSQEQKDPEWLEKYKNRSSIECKNSELKRFHGLYRAQGYSLESVSIQSKLTIIAVNLKTIARIMIKKNSDLTTIVIHIILITQKNNVERYNYMKMRKLA